MAIDLLTERGAKLALKTIKGVEEEGVGGGGGRGQVMRTAPNLLQRHALAHTPSPASGYEVAVDYQKLQRPLR